MKKSRALTLGALVLALSAAIATPALADDRGRGRGHDRAPDRGHDSRRDPRRADRGPERRDVRDPRRDDRRQVRSHDDRRPVNVAPPRVVHHQPVRVVHSHGSRGYGPPPWARGRAYHHHGYAPTYVVHDYRPYGLRAPPRGHYWRRSDSGDFLLVAAATGIIADLILRGGY